MILTIVQARMSSTRLLGKVLMKYNNISMLNIMLDRIKKSKMINKIIVATSTNTEDDAIVAECDKCRIEYFRGSLNNVLERFYQCAIQYSPTHVVRLTADCPLHDAKIIDDIINAHMINNNDYTTNAGDHRTSPDGMDVEVFKIQNLIDAYNNTNDAIDQEHVTPYIQRNAIRKELVKNSEDLSKIRITLDYKADFETICNILDHSKKHYLDITTEDIKQLYFTKPEIFVNKHLVIY
jgi:spore coat polysaccharide biosynthesis protein SpsF